MQSAGICAGCSEARKKKTIPPSLKPIGEEVVRTIRLGRGSDQTTYRFAQCGDCGSVWMTYEDSGAGGHGRHHELLTSF